MMERIVAAPQYFYKIAHGKLVRLFYSIFRCAAPFDCTVILFATNIGVLCTQKQIQ